MTRRSTPVLCSGPDARTVWRSLQLMVSARIWSDDVMRNGGHLPESLRAQGFDSMWETAPRLRDADLATLSDGVEKRESSRTEQEATGVVLCEYRIVANLSRRCSPGRPVAEDRVNCRLASCSQAGGCEGRGAVERYGRRFVRKRGAVARADGIAPTSEALVLLPAATTPGGTPLGRRCLCQHHGAPGRLSDGCR